MRERSIAPGIPTAIAALALAALPAAAGTTPDANLRQQATMPETANGTDLSTRQVTQVTTKGDDVFIRMEQEVHLRAQQLDQAAAQPGGEARVTRAVASTFGTSEARIRAEQGKHHLGVGELVIARALARATAHSDRPLTLRQVIELRQREGGWGQVFHFLKNEGLVDEKNMGQIVRHARAAAATSGARAGTGTARADSRVRTGGGTAAARARPMAITTAGNRTDVVGGGPKGQPPVAAEGHGRGDAASAAITSAGNGTQAGGRAAATAAGHGRGGHGSGGHGGPKK